MKVCCDNGKPYDSLSEFERLGACNNDHCVGPIEVEEFDLLLTGLGAFDTKDCISHEAMRHLFNKTESWEEWIASQVEQEGIDKYKEWYDRMLQRGAICDELIEANNKLFNGEKE